MWRVARWVGAVLLVVLVAAAVVAAVETAAVAAGFFAKQLCSGVFVAGRAPEAVAEGDLRHYPPRWAMRFIRWSLDVPSGVARADLAGIGAREARVRGADGCVLLPDDEVASRVSRVSAAAASAAIVTAPPVGGALPEAPPWPNVVDVPSALEAAVSAAFEEVETNPALQRGTRAVFIVHHGRVVAERYAAGFDRASRFPGWSIAKSVTHALTGVLVAEGLIAVDEPVPVPAWQTTGDPRQAITWEHLLRMTSGLAFDETYVNPFADVNHMLWRARDAGTAAARAPLRDPPGQSWRYDSGTTNILMRALRERMEGRRPADTVQSVMRARLFDPLGMTSALLEPDAGGTPVGSSFIHATAADYARFGWLYANDGEWEGRRILPLGWVAHAMRETSQSNGRFGAHFWIGVPERERPRFADEAPAMLHAMGFAGQAITIVPERRLVIVRLGQTIERASWNHWAFVAAVLAALPGTATRPDGHR